MNASSSTEQSHLRYRADIDGLRAIAVLAVVFFHAFPSLLRGGFVGVDVFFVISGFLISSIIFKGLATGTFSFKTFYSRRIKRIFPALIIVLLSCYVIGWVTLIPDEFKQLGKHIAAGAGFVQNVVLWKESGYFDIESDLKPLVHLWSLAIEEQFYLVFPLLIWCFWRLRFNVLLVLLSLFVVSFGLNIYTVSADSVRAYFSPETRVWELLAGAILAYLQSFKSFHLRTQLQSNVSSVIGLALIVSAMFLVSKDRSFPGWWALLPVTGTLLLLLAGNDGVVARRILSTRPMVFVGLISYPLYLWHWPLLTFAKVVGSEVPNVQVRSAIVLLSFFLAWITYKLIESPFKVDSRAKVKITALVCCLIVVGFGGYNAFKRNGLKFREVVRLNNFEKTGRTYSDYKFIIAGCGLPDNRAAKMAKCQSDSRGEAKFALIGDSKAASLAPGVFFKSTDQGRWLLIGGTGDYSAPVPVISDAEIYSAFQPRIKDALQAVIENPRIEVVVIATAARSLLKLKNAFSIEDMPLSLNYGVAYLGLSKTMDELVKGGKKVVLLVDNPTFPDARTCFKRVTAFAKEMAQPDLEKCQISYAKQLELTALYRSMLKQVQMQHPQSVTIFDPTDLLCEVAEGTCTVSRANRLLYSYSDHLSDYASHVVASELVPFVEHYAQGESN